VEPRLLLTSIPERVTERRRAVLTLFGQATLVRVSERV
jgi:hypothetical protein